METDVAAAGLLADRAVGHRRARESGALGWRPRLAAPLRTPAAARAAGILSAAALPAALIAAWQLCADRGWISALVLPPPGAVLGTLRDLAADGTLRASLAVSALRVARGFGIGAAVGLTLGTAFGTSALLRAWVQPTVLAAHQVNLMAWIPLLILVFGIDEALKTAAIAYASVLPVMINVAKGIAAIPTAWFELARVHQLRRREVLWRIAVPAALPALFTGLRSGLGAAWMSLVAVEMVASSEGVGFMVVWGRQLFQLDLVLAAIVVIGAVGLGLDLALSALDRRLRRWQRAAF
jgi:sulfonate transport system permease protein